MPESASHYPISQFLLGLLEELGLDRDGFLVALGYRNLERGRRRLDAWIDEGTGFERILKQISAAYPTSDDRLQTAIMNTAALKKAESEAAFLERCKAEEASFVPFVYAQGEKSVPSQITFFGMTGSHLRWTDIQIAKTILSLPIEEQLAKLPHLMLAYGRQYEAQVPFFGRLTGFLYVRCLDHFRFNKEGEFIERVDRPFRHGECWVDLR